MSQVFSWRSSRHNCYCYKDKSQNFSKRSSSVVTPLTPVGRDTWPRNEGTVRSTCRATTCIRIPGQLDHDLCKPAVNLMPFLLYSRDAIIIMFSQAYALTHGVLQETDPRLCCGPSGSVLLPLSSHVRGQSCTVAQLPRSRPSVSSLQGCKPTQNSLFVEATLVGHIHVHCLTPRASCERTRTTTSTHYNTYYTILTVERSVSTGSRAETHGETQGRDDTSTWATPPHERTPFFGQLKPVIKTMLWQGDLADFTRGQHHYNAEKQWLREHS